jgi:hypothetical protein
VQAQLYLPLLPEMFREVLRRLATPLRVWWRGNWFYRRLLQGPLADHFAFHPWDAAPRRLEEADALLRGRFRFYGVALDVPEGVSVCRRRTPIGRPRCTASPGCRPCPMPAATMPASWRQT